MKTNTPETLRQKASQLMALAEQIETLQNQANALVGELATPKVRKSVKTRKPKARGMNVKTKNGQVRHYSPEARAAIAAAQVRRHAAAKAAKAAPVTTPAAPLAAGVTET